MAEYCVLTPSRGKKTFEGLKKRFGYSDARKIFLTSLNQDFLEDYKDTLILDDEGVPTLQSILDNEYMKEFIGEERMLKGLNAPYKPMENTRSNYESALESAKEYNLTGEKHDEYVATVESEGDNIRVTIQRRTHDAEQRFQNQYGTKQLNDKLLEILSPLGVTINDLTEAEASSGINGVTDFDAAKNMASGLSTIIRVADSSAGYEAITEELSHLITALYEDEPLIQRALNTLENNPEAIAKILGDKYNEYVTKYGNDKSKLAFEALGHLFTDGLQKNAQNIPVKTQSFFQRVFNWIVNKFKNLYNPKSIDKIVQDIEASMIPFATSILEEQRKNLKSIKDVRRRGRFYSTVNSANKAIDLLNEVLKVEKKRVKIYDEGNAQYKVLQDRIDEYTAITEGIGQKLPEQALLEYIQQTLKEVDSIYKSLTDIDKLPLGDQFRILQNTNTYMKMYARIIDYYYKAAAANTEPDSFINTEYDIQGVKISIKSVLADAQDLNRLISEEYIKYAFPAFAKFLEPMLGTKIKIPFGKRKGEEIEVSELLKEMKDISFFDRWLDSMSNSSDIILQAMDRIVQKAKNDAHIKSLKDIRDIRALQQRMEKDGITDTSWMFETDNEGHKTGNYISEINHGQFKKDYEEIISAIKAKYGENPSGADLQAALNERKAWLNDHCIITPTGKIPNPDIYHNSAYDRLTDKQKSYLDEFIKLKEKIESGFPPNLQKPLRCIQMRKSRGQRFIESATSLNALVENIKGSLEEDYLHTEDDNEEYGENTKLMHFDNTEFMRLPLLYTRELNNKDELEEDVFKTLMNYQYMANRHDALAGVINEVEVSYDLMTKHRKYYNTQFGKPFKDLASDEKIYKEASEAEAKLRDWLESQVYGRYLKKEGDSEIGKVSVNKLGNQFIKLNSTLKMGFNWLADIANITTGLAMTNIEAAGGMFFSAKELLKADSEYSPMDAVKDSFNRQKETKQGLFGELFNIDEFYRTELRQTSQAKKTVLRLLNVPLAYLGQDCGQHWLSYRTGIAMAIRQQVLKNGQQMSLWDALEVKTDKNGNNYLNIDEITNLDGSKFEVFELAEKIKGVNHNLFGIYNESDQSAANRIVLGRAMLQFRKWMKPAYNTRFQSMQYNLRLNMWEEGYYRTFLRLAEECIRGERRVFADWKNLNEEERANVRKCICEVAQFAIVSLISGVLLGGDGDRDDDSFFFKLLEYVAKRLKHELGGLTPSLTMFGEITKTVQSPIPATSTLKDLFTLLNTAISIDGHDHEITSGPYKGLTPFEKAVIKAPIPAISYWHKIDKFINELDTQTQFYERPW